MPAAAAAAKTVKHGHTTMTKASRGWWTVEGKGVWRGGTANSSGQWDFRRRLSSLKWT